MEIKLNNRKISYRKWKVKDRNNFTNAEDRIQKRNALVYNCLENPNTSLDLEEYNYLLLKIRSDSLSPKIKYTLKCPECGKVFSAEIDLNDVLKVENKPLTAIKVNDVEIELQNVKHKESYENAINSTDDPYTKYLIDFVFHIKSINQNTALTFDDVFNFINDLDVDVFEKIFEQWEKQRFKINMTGFIECPYCNENTLYNFDDLPNFFPKSWNIRS